MSSYQTTVGIEVHAELKTRSKMFCGCKNDPHSSEPNQNVCPVCVAHPGTLPTVNEDAVRYLLEIGTAIGGTLADFSEFDRKNYFYPDIPKAYQISQYKYPFVTGGEIAGVAITRVHLEEDTARSQHDLGDYSVVDFNRAGVPLMELVTEPVIHDAKSAGAFAKELQLLLRSLGVSDANMEKGEMRVEANISVSKDSVLGTKVEVKNLNSFKSVESAIEYETKRQIALLEDGEPVVQETRGWDETKSKTFSQRAKESANDYRYFPDPDIPKFSRATANDIENSRLSEIIKYTPVFKRDNYAKLGLESKLVEIIIAERDRDDFFNATLASEKFVPGTEKLVANYFTSDLLNLLDTSRTLELANANNFAALIAMVASGLITSRVAKDILTEVVFGGLEPLKLAESRNLLQRNDEAYLLELIEKIVSENSAVADEYRGGKESALMFLVGQGMKVTKGSANPTTLASLFKKVLSK